jgi:hypothetical protein
MEGWWKMQYRISFEFRLTRRACWPGDGSDFYDHVNAVRGKIEAHEFVTDVRAITDFAESSLTFDFVLDAHGYQQAIPEALRLVREAIESCDARHFGMDSVGSRVLVGSGARAGLETPIWHKRRVLIDVAA